MQNSTHSWEYQALLNSAIKSQESSWEEGGGPKSYLVVVVEPATLKETLQKELLSLLEAMENDSILGEMKWGSVTEFLMLIYGFGAPTTLRKSHFEI
jgi:hypothetical protein